MINSDKKLSKIMISNDKLINSLSSCAIPADVTFVPFSWLLENVFPCYTMHHGIILHMKLEVTLHFQCFLLFHFSISKFQIESFGIFNIELLPMSSLPSFCVYGKNEISFLVEQFFPEKSVEIVLTEWEEFTFELIDIKQKYQLLKEHLTDNSLKLKVTASECFNI